MAEVRVSDASTELAAIKAMAAALEPLDLETRRRVLHWAGDKFVNHEVLKLSDETETFMETFTKTLQQLQDGAIRAGVTRRHYTIVAEKLIKDATEIAENEKGDA